MGGLSLACKELDPLKGNGRCDQVLLSRGIYVIKLYHRSRVHQWSFVITGPYTHVFPCMHAYTPISQDLYMHDAFIVHACSLNLTHDVIENQAGRVAKSFTTLVRYCPKQLKKKTTTTTTTPAHVEVAASKGSGAQQTERPQPRNGFIHIICKLTVSQV